MRAPSRRFRSIACLLLLAALSRPAAPEQVPVKSYVARALQYLEQGNDPVATAFARLAVQDDPGNAYAHWLLGYLLARAQDREGALDAFARARRLRPEWEVPREAIEMQLKGGVPRWLSGAAMEQLPGEIAAVEVALHREPGTMPQTASWRVYVPPADAPGLPLRDPKYGWEFPYHAYAFARAADAPRWERRFAIHYETESDAPLARRVATLLSQLASAALDRLGPQAAASGSETHLWLCRRGRAGGEEWRGNLYLYETGRSRSAGEWVREVAHEFGHVAIPGTRHYTEPEPKGNGYLGERLLPLWLHDAGNRSVWEGAVLLEEYLRARVFPAAAPFLDAGPAAVARSDRGGKGMAYAIGLVLALELAHEPDLIGPILRREIGSTPDNLLTAYRDRLRTLQPRSFRIHARAFIPSRSEAAVAAGGAVGRRLSYRVFLPAGEWSLRLEGDAAGEFRPRIGNQVLAAAGPGVFRWRSATSGWLMLELIGKETSSLRRLQFQAAGLEEGVSGNTN